MADTVFRTEITAEHTQFDAQMEAAAAKSMTTAQRMQSSFREASVNVDQSVKKGVGSMNSSFDAVRAGVEKVRGLIAGVAVVAGVVAIFGKYANEAAAAAKETEKLATLLGVATQEASALRIALDDIGSNTDTYVGALSKMTMKLREGEERFNELGVSTRDANGKLLSGDQIMQNALQTLLQFKEGTDRNLASTELFGKGWAEMSRLLKLTPAAMEEARKKGEELGLTLGPEGMARAEGYRRAMNDMNDVFQALGNRIGQVVMPVLTDIGEWFAERGPATVKTMNAVLGVSATVWYALKTVVVGVATAIVGSLSAVASMLGGLGAAVAMIMKGDFSTAKDVLVEGWRDAKSELAQIGGDIVAQFQRNSEALRIAMTMEAPGAKTPGQDGGRTWTPAAKKDTEKSQMPAFEAELAALRFAQEREAAARGSFQEMTKQQEAAFWLRILETRKLTDEERLAVSRKYYAAEREVRKDAFESELAGLKAQIEAHRAGAQERILIATELASRVAEKFGGESKEYRQAQAEIDRYRREAAERARELQDIELESYKQYQLQRVELERQNLDTLERLGLITGAQKLDALKQLKELEFQIELKAAEERALLLANDVVAYRKAIEQIEAIKRKHVLDQGKLDAQIGEEQKKTLGQWIDPISGAFEKMSTGIIMGTQRWRDALRRALISVGSEYLSMGVRILTNWVKTEILKTQATVAGVTARTAAETTGSSASIASTAGSAIANIGAKAWEAAASVYASIAQIPYIGPFLAPVMAVAAAAAVLGFIGKIASASGGFDVPSGMSPMTQLHEEEMVLPKHIANPLRESLEGGGGVGSGGGFNVYINAVDGRSVKELFKREGHAMADALLKQRRNFKR